MKDSTRKTPRVKPSKPRPDFPLFAHANGRWAKKVRQRLIYFGKWSDDPRGERALRLWTEQKDDLLAGRTPRRPGDEGETVADLCNQFLTAKTRRVESGELTRRSFLDYKRTTDGIIATLGKARRIDDLRPEDFERFRSKLAKRLGPVSLGNEINRIRIVFNFAYDQDLVDKPIKFGKNFNRPPKHVIRLERKKNGLRMFESAELRSLIDAADQPLKAMILLAINCGLGQSDIARLHTTHLDLKCGWLDYPRPKTGVDRRIPLWPETITALKEALALRPTVKARQHENLMFLTTRGNPWVRYSAAYKDERDRDKGNVPLDALGRTFIKLLKKLGLHRPGLGLYALRHTLETIGGEAKDQVALDAIMGHAREDMASVYRERISDERLQAVTDCVREWLWPKQEKDKK